MDTESSSAEAPQAAPAPTPAAVPAHAPVTGAAQGWTLIPVILQFTNVASNTNLNFTFTTSGASWSLGARSGDSIGFSYNVTPSSAGGQSCIQAIEFNNNVLSIRTNTGNQAGGQANNAFTLTLFLQVRPGIDYVQGYCTLNNEALVLATFGSLSPVQWRNGRISAVLLAPRINYRQISFTIKGATPGNRIDLIVSAKRGLGKAAWSIGPEFYESKGMELGSQQGEIPLSSVSFRDGTLSFVTTASSSNGSASATLEFFMHAYITWAPDDLNYVYLRTSTSNADITVLAQLSNRQPQIVSQSDTVFTL